MVKIVTGSMNSFKTTRLENLFNEDHLGDGFVSKKIMKDSLVYGYNLKRLSTEEEIPLVIRDIYWDGVKKIIFQIGPYCFFEEALIYLERIIDDFIIKNVNPVYLDEVGILELEGQGFDSIIKKLIEADIDLCLVVRTDLVARVCKHYNFINVEII